MEVAERDRLEAQLRAAYDAGNLRAVATEAIRGYGPELYGFLVGMARDQDAASEIFAAMLERLWKGLPGFRWESSLRVWAYAVARHEFFHWTRHRDKARRHVPLSDAPELGALAEQVRTRTAMHLRTEVKDELAKIRATLNPEDQLLLGLRLESNMAWNDIARVLAGEGAEPTAREVAALRKRFERLKTQLRELAREHELVP